MKITKVKSIPKKYLKKNWKKRINALLREAVGIRDNEKCQWCGSTQQLQMSHIFPKGRHRKMEFEIENLKLLCWKCHFTKWHRSPIEAWLWIETAIPKQRLDRLKLMANYVQKQPIDYALLELFLEQEIKRLKSIQK